MTMEEKLREIREHPELHRHSFDGLLACCMVNDALDTRLMQAHQDYAPIGSNGGVRCDVTYGPCACGGWHR